MRDPQTSLVIVSCYFIIGVLLMLASGQIAGFLKRLGSKTVRYTRIALLTFGGSVAAVAGFCLSLFVIAVLRQA